MRVPLPHPSILKGLNERSPLRRASVALYQLIAASHLTWYRPLLGHQEVRGDGAARRAHAHATERRGPGR